MKRRVRVHLVGVEQSIEGLLVRRPWTNDGHYRLVHVQVLDLDKQVNELASRESWIPRERVAFIEVMS